MDDTVAAFERVAGAALRSVVRFESTDFDLHYLRDDVEASYSDQEEQRLYREMVAQNIGDMTLENSLKGGSHECAVHVFTEITVFIFKESKYDGWYISIDRTPSVHADDVIELGTDHFS